MPVMANCRLVGVVFAIAVCFCGGSSGTPYYGKLLGKLSELHHGVSGEVYAVDGRTLYIKDFTYDGQGPAAYFYASTYKSADKKGFRLRDENGGGEVIRRYRKEGVTLTLPEGKHLNNIKIFYVWCEEFDVNFGDVKIPKNFDYPRPLKIDALRGVHAVASDNIVIVDAQTLLVPNLSYDGEAPDAKFWVGKGPKPSPQGIRVPDENGKEVPLRRYDRKTVVLTLPGDLTVFDIGHFGIWCEAFAVDFGHIQIPQLPNIPPSLKMLGVSPQSKLNCEVLYDDLAFEVRWAVAGESIVLQLVAKLGDREYMSFGLSGDESKSAMIGGDVVVAWVDKNTLKGYAEDYYLQDKAQCSGPKGSCPDNRLLETSNSIRLLNAATVNGYSIVTYQRSLRPSDQYDLPVRTNRSQPIIWAIGPLNQRDEVSFHSHYPKKDRFIDFGRPAKWNCPMPESEQPPMVVVDRQSSKYKDEGISNRGSYEDDDRTPTRGNEKHRGGNRGNIRQQHEDEFDDSKNSATRNREQTQRRKGPQRSNPTKAPATPAPVSKRDAWEIPPIQCFEPEDGVFYAQMGPTGGKKGYPAITGHVGWGISWYINGLLIPEINVVRGKTYTFVVEGGLDPEISAKYHPFYITDDPIGGYEYKTPEEKESIRIFAGAKKDKDGALVPTGIGRLCHWTQTGDLEADDFQSFGAYQRTLELKCDHGEPGVVQWTPDKNTPDTVYYQCFTHRYLGWKINVHDSCDEQPAASNLKLTVVPAPADFQDKYDLDLEESPSFRVETRVKPNDFLLDSKEDKDSKSPISEKKMISSPEVVSEESHSQSQPQNFDPFFQRKEPQFVNTNFQFDQYLQHKQNDHYFKPSTILETTFESTPLPTISLFTDSTTTSTSTTTETHIPQNNLKMIDNIAISSIASNESYLVPPSVGLPIQFTDNYYMRSPLRTQVYPKRHVSYAPVKFTTRYSMPQRQKIPFKKPIGRFPPNLPRPYQFEYDKPLFVATPTQIRPQILPQHVAQPIQIITRSPPIKTQLVTDIKPLEVKNVEISPLQASTEKEPEIQTAPTPTFKEITATYVHPAYNTGFKPGSIKMESGFKPIITKEFKKRMDEEDDIEVNDEGETGFIDKDNADNLEHKPLHLFEPMFVPSPTDKPVKEKYIKVYKRPVNKKRGQYTKIIVKQPRSINDTDELVAEAAERAETYYLPPTGQKPFSVIREPSNIDIEAPPDTDLNIDSPPDVVVTYDGKKVSGQSLTAKLSDKPVFLEQRLSKASAYIKARPQFGKFKGELPPLNPELLFSNVPQENLAVLNRDLDTPPIGDSIKLTRVYGRRKREAHHTPEHTAEQEAEPKKQESGSSRLLGNVCLVIVGYFLKYIYV